MSSNLTQDPENLPRQTTESKELDSKIKGIRQLIDALQYELAQLEERQSSSQHLETQPERDVPPVTEDVEVKPRPSQLSRRARLLLVVFAFVLAGIGQVLLHASAENGGRTVNGWIFYGMAAALFVLALRHVTIVQFAEGRLGDAPLENFRSSPAFWALLTLGILAMLGSLVLFRTPTTVVLAWYLHVASWLLFILAFIPFDKLRPTHLPSRTQLLAQLLRALPVVAVLVLATFARLWQLNQFPFGTWYDEADNGLVAAHILTDPSYRPLYLDAIAMPAHFNYLISLAFSIWGTNILSLRLVTAGFGILTVLFAYLLFRRWFGETMGIVAACLLAVMRYHLTFSRFGMQGITTPAFELAVLYFLDRALTHKKVSDFAWLGLSIGFGLAIHTAFRLFPVVLAIFFVGLLVAALMKSGICEAIRRYVRGLLPQWLILALAFTIAIAPVAQFALMNQENFLARTKTVSIFEQHKEKDLETALWNNAVKHLEMFNVRGDRNGRHNLPGAPMLDPVMGVLSVLGVAYALWHWRDAPNALMLLLFLIMLQAGILSLDFEAPQSYRAIGIIPAIIYFATVPIAAIGKGFFQAHQPTEPNPALSSRPALFGLGLIPVLGLITYLNFTSFFIDQKNDPAAWAQYSTAETIVANEMNRLAAQDDLIVTATYYGHPTLRFLAGSIPDVQRWTSTDRLPVVHADNGRGVAMMFDGRLISSYNDARRFYPNAKFIEHHAPSGGGTVMYEVILTPDDLRAVSGVVARYFRGNTLEGQPVKEEVLPGASLDWTKSQSLQEAFLADLRSTLYITEYGQYKFNIRNAPDSKLWIDEFRVSDDPVLLARGNHVLRLEVPGSKGKMELWWQPPGNGDAEPLPSIYLFRPPVTNNGLLGAYYPSPDWSGNPAFAQIDPEIAYYFHMIPLPRPYTVEWTGKLFAPTDGEYRFALNSVDGSQLKLDDRIVVDNPNGRTTVENVTSLTQGWHDIMVRFADRTSATQIYLYWTPPGAGRSELIPSRYLLPPMGDYPTPSEAGH